MVKKIKYLIIFTVLLVLFGFGYMCRYQIFNKWSPEAVGNLVFTEDLGTQESINQFFEEYHTKKGSRPYKCSHNFWARDERFIYIDLVCGKFHQTKENTVETDYGYRAPTRIEIDGANKILAFKQPIDGEDHIASYNWLFPKAVQEKDRAIKSTGPWKDIHLKIFDRNY